MCKLFAFRSTIEIFPRNGEFSDTASAELLCRNSTTCQLKAKEFAHYRINGGLSRQLRESHQFSHDGRDLSHHFSIATISKLFSQIQMLCIRMHDQCAVF